MSAILGGAIASVFRRPRSQVSLNLNTFFTRQPDQDDGSRTSLNLGSLRFLPGRWLVGVAGQFEKNRDLGFDLRTTVRGLAGRELVKTNRQQFISHDSRPPTEGAKKNDVALSISLGWTF